MLMTLLLVVGLVTGFPKQEKKDKNKEENMVPDVTTTRKPEQCAPDIYCKYEFMYTESCSMWASFSKILAIKQTCSVLKSQPCFMYV